MEITTEPKDNNILVIYLNGRLDATTSGGLQKEINQLIEADNIKILINFEKLDYISSAGLRVLITTVKLLQVKQGKLLLSNMNSMIFDVLKISGFTKILTICDSQQQALAAF